MIFSGIDVGTNTVLLLIAEVDHHGVITALEQQQRIPRLGKDVDARNEISIPAFDRIAWILNEYRAISQQLNATRILACATSAVRDASNKHEFLGYLRKVTGIDVEVLTGEGEALLTYEGALSGLDRTSHEYAVLDVGGGSTELTYPAPHARSGPSPLNRYSFQIGSVRISERFFKHDPPLEEEIDGAREFIRGELARVQHPDLQGFRLVGVAGTATTLACLDQGLSEFDLTKVSGYEIPSDRLATWLLKLQSMPSDELRRLSRATEGREDILTAGVLVMNEVVRLFGFRKLLVSERGLRYGLIAREWQRSRSNEGRG